MMKNSNLYIIISLLFIISFLNGTAISEKQVIKVSNNFISERFNPFERTINNIYLDGNTKEILSYKKGLIFMTAHIGNWEILLPILSKYKKTTAIVKIQRNLGGDKFVSELRTKDGSTYAIGNLIPDAFSILAIPSKTKENLLLINSNTFFGSKFEV